MAFDSHMCRDPAEHVKYERQTNPCYGCKNKAAQPGRKFCEIGKRKCSLYKEAE